MQPNVTTEPTTTQTALTTTQDGPQWTTTRAANAQPRRRPDGEMCQRIVDTADHFLAWLQSLNSTQWQTLYGVHTPAELDTAIQKCRQFKNARAKYNEAGKPTRWTTRLQQLQTAMRATLQGLGFKNPQTLWTTYQQAQYLDDNGYTFAHAAHIANVDHYLWLRDVTATHPIDNNDGGYTSPYANNVSAAVEETRYHAAAYAITDDGDNPQHRQEAIRRRLVNAQAHQRSLYKRIKTTTNKIAARKYKARFNALAAEIADLRMEDAELTELLTPPTDATGEPLVDPQEWADRIAHQMSDYGLSRTAPAAPNAKVVDIYETTAETNATIQHLAELETETRQLIAWLDMVQAEGLTLNRIETQMQEEAHDLLPVIQTSIAHHRISLQA